MRTRILLLPCLALAACSDIIETDLSGFGVVLLTPADGYETNSNVVTFKWEAVPHATEYHLQIARPNFDQPVQFVADTVFPHAGISLPLQPGSYVWRVQARNGNSSTNYYQRSLTVIPASSLDDLLPVLTAPAANAVTAAEPVTFHWQALAGADDYRFELRNNDPTGTLVQAQITAATQMTVAGLTEGTYAWGVQGHNSTSSSLFSYRTLRIDRTAPTAPLLVTPAANATIPNTAFTFQWQSGTDAGALVDSLFVTDVNTVTIRALAPAGTTYTDSLGAGTFHWYVRSTDAAGNGTSATPRTLTIQP